MTWELVALALLGATLLGGFTWYERSRPPSQIVALVAALAAISVAGRVAFSPIPNVVPTTDITLVAGFALGGAPGSTAPARARSSRPVPRGLRPRSPGPHPARSPRPA